MTGQARLHDPRVDRHGARGHRLLAPPPGPFSPTCLLHSRRPRDTSSRPTHMTPRKTRCLSCFPGQEPQAGTRGVSHSDVNQGSTGGASRQPPGPSARACSHGSGPRHVHPISLLPVGFVGGLRDPPGRGPNRKALVQK